MTTYVTVLISCKSNFIPRFTRITFCPLHTLIVNGWAACAEQRSLIDIFNTEQILLIKEKESRQRRLSFSFHIEYTVDKQSFLTTCDPVSFCKEARHMSEILKLRYDRFPPSSLGRRQTGSRALTLPGRSLRKSFGRKKKPHPPAMPGKSCPMPAYLPHSRHTGS